MPGIVMFGRRWGIASDDFFVPGVVLFFFHISWIIAYTYLIRKLLELQWEEQVCTSLLFYYTALYLALSGINAVVELIIAGLSVRGGIQDAHKRRGIIHLLYLRLGLLIVEFFCLIAGTLWKVFYFAKCAISEAFGKVFLGKSDDSEQDTDDDLSSDDE